MAAGRLELTIARPLKLHIPLQSFSTIIFAWPGKVHAGVTQIRVSQYNGTSWAFIDGDAATGINYSTTYNAYNPHLAATDATTLYAVWRERNSGGFYIIRAKKYVAGIWSQIDGGGLNYSTSENAQDPQVAFFNGLLYVTWVEEVSTTLYQIRVKNFNPTTSTWTWADSGSSIGINYNSSLTAYYNDLNVNPYLAVYDSNLYAIWSENDPSGVAQIRVAKYLSGANWDNSIDGGGTEGLNHNTGKNAIQPKAISANGFLYVTWAENNGANYDTRVSAYQNVISPYWNFIDGDGASGINMATSLLASMPLVVNLNENLYFGWSELDSSGNGQIRLRVSQ